MLRVVKWIYRIAGGSILLLAILLSLNSLNYKPIRYYNTPRVIRETFSELKNNKSFIEDLYQKYSKEKVLPSKYEIQALIALSYFPELKDVPVTFAEEEAKFPLSSYPSPISLLNPFGKRSYRIVISTRSLPAFEKILLKELPFDAQIGVIGHELAHTSYYLDKNSWELLWMGIKYLFSDKYRKLFETETDVATINHGLGYQLLNWRIYFEGLFKPEHKQELYKDIYFEDRYLNSTEIIGKISKSPLYSH